MTSEYYPPWPPTGTPWPETRTSSTDGKQPDFPDSPGDREKGKFRPSSRPRLTTIAVVGDDGQPVGSASAASALSTQDEILIYMRAIAYGVAQMNSMDIDDLLEAANSE